MSLTALRSRADELGIDEFTGPELGMVWQTIEILRPDFIAEWGTNVGYTARVFLEARDIAKLGCPIHSFELKETAPLIRPADVGKARGHHVLGTSVELHVGNGPVEAILAHRRVGGSRPLFFVDDNHEYDHVLMTLMLLWEEVPNGTILVHDSSFAGDTGPDRAIREFLERRGHLYVYSEVPNMVRISPRGTGLW